MSRPISRMQFLRGDIRGDGAPLRPPWALPEAAFVDTCNRCGACIPACPQAILEKGRGGYPQVNFHYGECVFCRECLECCEEGALQAPNDPEASPWSLKARIENDCLALRGIVCGICAEQCEPRAIRMRPRVGGPVVPVIQTVVCTGCGACYQNCPAKAVAMGPSGRGERILSASEEARP